jgi:hypothetical protein
MRGKKSKSEKRGIFKTSISTRKKKKIGLFVTKTSRLKMFRETVSVYYENQIETASMLKGQNYKLVILI